MLVFFKLLLSGITMEECAVSLTNFLADLFAGPMANQIEVTDERVLAYLLTPYIDQTPMSRISQSQRQPFFY